MSLRQDNIARLSHETLNVLVIGGGINGAVSAAALAAKGAKVGLIDRGDFAGETSSQSSNLAWGGIKYLESHEYFLVNRLCKSRNHLMENYPSTVKEIRFLTSIAKGFRFPAPLIYLGALVYWLLGRCSTRAPVYYRTNQLAQAEVVINTEDVQGGFEYSDCYLYDNDARFVFNFISASIDYGGTAANYVESLGSQRRDGLWHTRVRDSISGDEFLIKSKVLINACGPYVDTHNHLAAQHTKHHHLFSKGVHLIVDRITDNNKVLAFFASDGRLFFIMPMGPKTCIGTTDEQVDSPQTAVTDNDRDFILENVNNLLALTKPLTKEDIIAERCGVRPLVTTRQETIEDWVKLSRKHAIEINHSDYHLSIFGGKLTDCINVGDEIAGAVDGLGVKLPAADKKWYGEPEHKIHQEFLSRAKAIKLDEMTAQSSSEPLTQRLWRRYGRKSFQLLDAIALEPKSAELLIENAEYLRCEVELAARDEMIVTLEDFLRRRSKISQVIKHQSLIESDGLKQACDILFGDDAENKLAQYIAEHHKP